MRINKAVGWLAIDVWDGGISESLLYVVTGVVVDLGIFVSFPCFEKVLSDVMSEALAVGTGDERLADVNVNVSAAVMALEVPMTIP